MKHSTQAGGGINKSAEMVPARLQEREAVMEA